MCLCAKAGIKARHVALLLLCISLSQNAAHFWATCIKEPHEISAVMLQV